MSGPSVYVVGSGPNGLTAAVTMARAGREVHVYEAAATPGGGARTSALIEPATLHDVCSAVHPLAVASPVFRDLPLDRFGVQWRHPEIEVAHVLDGGRAAVLRRSLDATVDGLGAGGPPWRRAFEPLLRGGSGLVDALLSPLELPPAHPLQLVRFALAGVQPASRFTQRFDSDAAGLFAGLAAHAMLPLSAPATTGYGLVLGLLGHLVGWPVPVGGSQRITDALVGMLEASGGTIECSRPVERLSELPAGATVLLDVTPRQFLELAGDLLPDRYARRLGRFRPGPGVFKLDYLLSESIPWTAPHARTAGTVHVGGTFAEVAEAEAAVASGRHPDQPFVLVSEPTRLDPARSSSGRSVAWAYCHVPNGSTLDMTDAIESRIERFAPGFRDVIVARHAMGPAAMQRYNANYAGGDIGAGSGDLRQLVARPVPSLRPWRTPLEGVYLCSASTPPGPGVHGMCGWHAARRALLDGR